MGGSSSKPKVTARDRAILELKVQRDRLKQYQKKITTVLNRETEIAKEQLKAGNRDMALLALKKKKYQEQLMEKTSGQLFNIEQLTSNIEFAQVELEVFNGLKQGNQVLGEIQKEMSLEDVEMLMSETAEAVSYQNQISEMLAGRISEEDEEDILAELEGITSELAEEQLQYLPTVPQTEPVAVAVEEEEDTVQDMVKDRIAFAN